MGEVIKVDNFDLCEICKKRKATLLCDMPTGIIITTSRNFGTYTSTCDKKICLKCATEVNEGIHFCKSCTDKLKNIQGGK